MGVGSGTLGALSLARHRSNPYNGIADRPLARVWAFAQAWYGDRMDPAFRGRTAGQARAVFARVGLTSAFWQADAP
jgi:hypothetical protein